MLKSLIKDSLWPNLKDNLVKKLCIVNASTVNSIRQILVEHGVKTSQCAVYFCCSD